MLLISGIVMNVCYVVNKNRKIKRYLCFLSYLVSNAVTFLFLVVLIFFFWLSTLALKSNVISAIQIAITRLERNQSLILLIIS